jgi:hypothetical protein
MDAPDVAKRESSPKRLLWLAVKLVVAAGLLYWLVSSGKLDFTPLLENPVMWEAGAGVLSIALYLYLQVFRWRAVLRMQGVRTTKWEALKLSWIGHFFSLVLPGAAGGEAARGYYIFKRARASRFAAVSTVVVDRGMGLYSLFIFGAAAALIDPGLLSFEGRASETFLALMAAPFLAITLGLALLPLAARSSKLREMIPERISRPVFGTYDNYRARLGELFGWLAFSTAINVFIILGYYFAARALGSNADYVDLMGVIPITTVANNLPLSPGGLGVGESVAQAVFSRYGLTMGASAMLLVRLWLAIVRLPGGVIYLFTKSSEGEENAPD